MARLTIIQQRGKFSITIPHKILIDGQFVGIMKDKQVTIEMPMGQYNITIQSMVPFISSTQTVDLQYNSNISLSFSDREQLWDALFILDIILWIVKRFLHLASPWTWIYEIFTNAYFVLWLIYEWRIRNHYFKFHLENQ
ncbi:MAG: hypothetical protein MJZ86_05455 [Bacteroidales bacterium]|nr:hypothetical protein [Bacteroidales bacterium]MCQ2287397.1 hypothetical protein [Bacteroidales bacterium]